MFLQVNKAVTHLLFVLVYIFLCYFASTCNHSTHLCNPSFLLDYDAYPCGNGHEYSNQPTSHDYIVFEQAMALREHEKKPNLYIHNNHKQNQTHSPSINPIFRYHTSQVPKSSYHSMKSLKTLTSLFYLFQK